MPFIENPTTRFFSVVGAAYIPEHHADRFGTMVRRRAPQRFEPGVDTRSGSGATVWWPQDRR